MTTYNDLRKSVRKASSITFKAEGNFKLLTCRDCNGKTKQIGRSYQSGRFMLAYSVCTCCGLCSHTIVAIAKTVVWDNKKQQLKYTF